MFAPVERPTSAVISEDQQLLHWVRKPEVLIAVYRRRVVPALRCYVDEVLNQRLFRRVALTVDGLVHELPAGPGREEFEADLCWQVDLFREIVGNHQMCLKLESFAGGLCERFHVDQVPIRLICSYVGPGTEWVEEKDIDRAKLGPGSAGVPDEESGLLRPGAQVSQVERFAVGLMKGTLWPGSQGLAHRSPRAVSPTAQRVLFKIDVT